MKCPHCNHDNLTIHTVNCPECESRVRCPECGSTLHYKDTDYERVECPNCDFKMPHAFNEIKALRVEPSECGLEPEAVSPPIEEVPDWEKDRWEAANQLLFPRPGDQAVLLFIVAKDGIHSYSATHPDFKHTLRVQLDMTSKRLKEDIFGHHTS